MRQAEPELYVATIGRPTRGDTGVQTHIRGFLRYTAERGIAARLVTPFDLPRLVVYPVLGIGRLAKTLGAEPWVWSYRSARLVLLRRALRRVVRPGARVIVYAQDLLSARAALDAREAHRGVEIVLVVHSSASEADEWVENGFVHRTGWLYEHIARLEREVLRRVDRLVFPSAFVERGVTRRIAGADAIPSWRIPNVVAAPSAASRTVVRGDVISIGPLVPNKNHEFLIRVLAEAHRMGYRYRLTIVGAGPLRARLLALADRLGVGSHVVLTGYVPEAARLLPGHRVYAHAARLENCCMAVLEALAAGRPVLAAPSGGVPEQITDDVEGVYWMLDDPVSAAYRLIGVLEDAARYARLSRAARARYERQFAPEILMPKLVAAVLGSSTPDTRPPSPRERHRDVVC